jgi:hypothetical protein
MDRGARLFRCRTLLSPTLLLIVVGSLACQIRRSRWLLLTSITGAQITKAKSICNFLFRCSQIGDRGALAIAWLQSETGLAAVNGDLEKRTVRNLPSYFVCLPLSCLLDCLRSYYLACSFAGVLA